MSAYNLIKFVIQHPLNKNSKISALSRVFKWQIVSRLIKGPIALPFAEDTFLFSKRGLTGATGNYYCGLHEFAEMGFLLHFLRETSSFVDVGANIGSYTVLAAGCVKCNVISVEPVPSTFENLRNNVRLNYLDNKVRLVQKGISDREGVLKFSKSLDTVNHVLVDGESHDSIDVLVTTLDQALENKAPELIKIDVEGFEKNVLLGASSVLSNPRLKAIIMEINGSGNRYGVSDDELLGIMKNYGFMPYSYNPFKRELVEFDIKSGNAVFVRDNTFVLERVKSSRKYNLINGAI